METNIFLHRISLKSNKGVTNGFSYIFIGLAPNSSDVCKWGIIPRKVCDIHSWIDTTMKLTDVIEYIKTTIFCIQTFFLLSIFFTLGMHGSCTCIITLPIKYRNWRKTSYTKAGCLEVIDQFGEFHGGIYWAVHKRLFSWNKASLSLDKMD